MFIIYNIRETSFGFMPYVIINKPYIYQKYCCAMTEINISTYTYNFIISTTVSPLSNKKKNRMACGKFKPTKNWMNRSKKNIYIIKFIKYHKLKCLGHVERIPKEREVTRTYKWKPLASRPIGRPKNRWEDDVRKDLQTVKINPWAPKDIYIYIYI